MAPLARLQYTLEQHRNGTANIPTGVLDASVAVGVKSGASGDDGRVTDGAATATVAGGVGVGVDEVTGGSRHKEERTRRRRKMGGAEDKEEEGEEGRASERDASRLLPPVVVPQVREREGFVGWLYVYHGVILSYYHSDILLVVQCERAVGFCCTFIISVILS